MTFLPVVARELGRAARKPSMYRRRTLAAAFSLGFIVLALLGDSDLAVVGYKVFLALGILAMAACLFLGLVLTSATIAAEKEDGTLGLLFLTDLTGFDIVAGKLAAHSVEALLTLLAIFPMLALPLLSGGVTGAEFTRSTFVFASTLVLSLCVGLAASAACGEEKKALGMAVVTMTFLAALYPLVIWAQYLAGHIASLEVLPYCSPVCAFIHCLDRGYMVTHGAEDFWRSLAAIWILSGICLGIASHHTAKAWKTKDGLVPVRRELASKRRRWRPAPIANPYLSVAQLDDKPSRIASGLILVVLLAWGGFLLTAMGSSNVNLGYYVSFAVLIGLHITVKLLMTIEAAFRLNRDRNSGALELLLTTPVQPRAIVKALQEAQDQHFRFAIWSLGLMNFVLLALSSDRRDMEFEAMMSLLVSIGSTMMLLFDGAALSWVARLNSLTRVHAGTAVMAAVGQVLAPFWVSVLIPVGVGVWYPFMMTWAPLLVLICIVANAINLNVSKDKLFLRFRELAARRPDKTG